jgi:hypothetical protein
LNQDKNQGRKGAERIYEVNDLFFINEKIVQVEMEKEISSQTNKQDYENNVDEETFTHSGWRQSNRY